MSTSTIETRNLNDECCHLIMDYASGALDEGLALVMASYVSLSLYAQDQLRYLEAIGGALMGADCPPTAMKEDSLEQCLALLDDIEATARYKQTEKPHILPDFPECSKMPAPVLHHIAAYSKKQPKWIKSLKGIEIMDVPLSHSSACYVRLMKIAPGIETPEHSHQGIELTLVLDGAFKDETGSFNAGDVILHDDDTLHHQPVACPERGCICIVATEAPIRFTKGWMRLLNPFVK